LVWRPGRVAYLDSEEPVTRVHPFKPDLAACNFEGNNPGLAFCFHAVRATVLPSDSGFEREIQHSAIGYGICRARIQAAGHAGRNHIAGGNQDPTRTWPDHV